MNKTYEKYKAFDKAFKKFELTFCALSILFVTFLVTLGIVLKNFSDFFSLDRGALPIHHGLGGLYRRRYQR